MSLAGLSERVRSTVALIEGRGYALPPEKLGLVCLGGKLEAAEVLRAVAGSPDLCLADGLVLSRSAAWRAPAIRARAAGHAAAREVYWGEARAFARRLSRLPFVLAVSIAGSLASGGFTSSDDIDLNLIVADGSRYRAYCALNLLGYLHAFRHRSKPVDVHTRRPLAPRLMTANLILELSDCRPLLRQDAAMAFELLSSEPVVGARVTRAVIEANPGLGRHFPQLWDAVPPPSQPQPPALPAGVAPGWLEPVAEGLGRAAWRYMQWTRRNSPEALARVAFVRETMRPYALFPDL